jgi:hypothetical protein
MYRGIFVDDEEDVYADIMSIPGRLEFVRFDVHPLTEQALSIRKAEPLIVALDYRLDEVLSNVTADHSYKGSGLAQLLRDKAIAEPEKDFSIVLVSNEMKLKKMYAPDKTAHDLFDVVYSKEEVTSNQECVKAQLLDLASAYADLRSLKKYDLKCLLGAKDDNDIVFDSQELRLGFESAEAPHLAIRHILRSVIGRNGLLLDRNNASARLGIDPEDMLKIEAKLREREIDYRGLLATGWPRWWGHRLDAFCDEVFGQRAISLTADVRAKRLSDALGEPLRPCVSPWNGRSDEYPAFACASCERPTELSHSLAAFDPHAPKFADLKRVCWDCIQTDKYLELNSPLAIDETDIGLVPDIQRLDRNQ